MGRNLVLALGLLAAPAFVSAQIEIGLDTGLEIEMVDGSDDRTSFRLPTTWARVAFTAGESVLVEPLLGLEYSTEGDLSETTLFIVPGVSYLLGEQFYVRGEVGLASYRYSESDVGVDFSTTQYGFGGGAGMRVRLGDSALLRLEAVADYWLEDTDEGVPERTNIRVVAGASAIIS